MSQKTRRIVSWISVAVAAAAVILLVTSSAQAIPAFARKYNVKCFTCHTVFPRLNKTGYLFKRLGYRFPPDLEPGQTPPLISELDAKIPWKLENSAALLMATSASWEQTKTDDSTESASSFNLDEASLFLGGSVPDSNFSYFAEYVMYEDGESQLERAKIDYTVGNAKSWFFVGLGKTHLQEGFKASDMHGLVEDDAPIGFMMPSLNNFSLDQNPGLVEAGYTWASPYYAQAVALTLKVSNGVDAEGEGIGSASDRKHKDVWFEGDFLFGPDGGISVMNYNGEKPQVGNEGAPDEFTYSPRTRRTGVFASYLFFDKLDILSGYLQSREDWKAAESDPLGKIDGRSYFGEVDYYLKTGFAVFGRYDYLRDRVKDNPALDPMKTTGYLVGVVKTLTDRGNLKASLTYGHTRTEDMTGAVETGNEAKFGLVLGW